MSSPLLDRLRAELACQSSQEVAATNLLERGPEFLVPSRASHGDVQMRVLDAFREAFDAFELLSILCGELAVESESEWVADVSDPASDSITMALRGMFWSGHVIAGEILALMRAGYPVGALARWRALHEVATQAEFMNCLMGPLAVQTARRYHAHDELRMSNTARSVQAVLKRFAPKQQFSKAEMTASDAIAARLVEEHGELFRGSYGWAHGALLEVSPPYHKSVESGKRPSGPQFPDIAALVHAESGERYVWRVLMADSNAAVHGATRSIRSPDASGDLPRLMSGPVIDAAMLWRVGVAAPARLVALLFAFAHPYPIEEDEDDEDELERLRLLETVVILGGLVEGLFTLRLDS